MNVGLTYDELAVKWNETLRQLGAKLAEPTLPPGISMAEFTRNAAAIRVPEPDPAKYPTYNAYLDMAAAVIAMIVLNNKKIVEQLQAAGIALG